jgi:hypothetical protein
MATRMSTSRECRPQPVLYKSQNEDADDLRIRNSKADQTNTATPELDWGKGRWTQMLTT